MALKTLYSTSAAITISINSLGNGSARGSAAIDNGTNGYVDAICRVSVSVTTGVTNDRQVLVYAYGSEDGTIYPDTVSGTDASVVLEAPSVLQVAYAIPTPTGGKVYESDAFSIARLYGGSMPRHWGLVVHNASGDALASTGNSATYTGITLSST
jgi:hypothetical protein